MKGGISVFLVGALNCAIYPTVAAAEDGTVAERLAVALNPIDREAIQDIAPAGPFVMSSNDELSRVDLSFVSEAIKGCQLAEVDSSANNAWLGSTGWLCEGRTPPDRPCFNLGYYVFVSAFTGTPALIITDGSSYSWSRCGVPIVEPMIPPPPPSKSTEGDQ